MITISFLNSFVRATSIIPASFITCIYVSEDDTAPRYCRIFAPDGNGLNDTEANIDVTARFGFQVIRTFMHVGVNAPTDDTVISFRDDGSSIGSLTAGSTATGDFESGALTDNVASGSLINFLKDSVAAGAVRVDLILVTYQIV